MKPIRVAAPASLPVTLEEVKEAARVDFDDDDQILRDCLLFCVSCRFFYK